MAIVKRTEVSVGEDVRKRSPRALSVGMRVAAATVENSVDLLQAVKS